MSDLKIGFEPFYDNDSRVLILGSFPSVISRKTDFYYGNPHNAFWRIISEHFNEPLPKTNEDKKSLLKRCKIALWDVVASCNIVGSQDATIKDFTVADIKGLLAKTNINCILLNGGRAAAIFEKYFKDIGVNYIKLPSTSPANTRRNEEEWYDALRRAFE
jgi:hypoxanthine-DNA glycosylase